MSLDLPTFGTSFGTSFFQGIFFNTGQECGLEKNVVSRRSDLDKEITERDQGKALRSGKSFRIREKCWDQGKVLGSGVSFVSGLECREGMYHESIKRGRMYQRGKSKESDKYRGKE